MLHNFKYSFRKMAKYPGFTLVIIGTLALGIGLNTIVFSMLNGALLAALPFEDADRLVTIKETNPRRPEASVAAPNFLDWQAQVRSFSKISAFQGTEVEITFNSAIERVRSGIVSTNWFETMDVRPVFGRPFRPEDTTEGVVVAIGEVFWKRMFGGAPDVLGKEISLGQQKARIIAVIPEGFGFPHQAEIWVPMVFDPVRDTRTQRSLGVVARLRDGVSLETARTEMETISVRLQQQYPEANKNWRALILPIRNLFVPTQARMFLYALMGGVGLVLLIALLSGSNLMIARILDRTPELAMRSALGATTRRLVSEIAVENVVMCVIGAVLGCAFAVLGTHFLREAIPVALPAWMKIQVDSRVMGFAFSLALFTSLALTAIPVFQLRRIDLNTLLQQHGRTSGQTGRSTRTRSVLVGVEVALSLVLLVVAGVLVNNFIRLHRVNAGFNPERVMTARLPTLLDAHYSTNEQVVRFYKDLVKRLETGPGVIGAGASSQIPLEHTGGMESSMLVEGEPSPPSGNQLMANLQVITPGYFRAMEIPIMRGRDFTELDANLLTPPENCACEWKGKSGVAIISENTAQRLFPVGDSIGKRISVAGKTGPWLEIVAVVSGIHHRGLDRAPMLDVYMPHAQRPQRGMTLVVRTEQRNPRFAKDLRLVIQTVNSEQPIASIRSMEDVVANSLWIHRLTTHLLLLFALTALLISAVGLYGIVLYSVVRRTGEIGVRIALGARSGNVRWMIIRSSFWTTVSGIVAGLPLAYLATRAMEKMTPGLDGHSTSVLIAVPLLLIAITVLTTLGPARRATSVDPMTALRSS